MKIYEKYILKKILMTMLVITISITGIAWLSQSLRFIDFIVNKGLNVSTFIYLTSLILPSLMWVVVPFCLYISIIYTLNKLANDSELIILQTTSLNPKQIAKPIIKFSIICVFISLMIGFYFMPSSFRQFKDMQNEIRNSYATILLQEGVFSSPSDDLTIYIEEKLSNTSFKSLVVHDTREEGKKVTISAREGTLTETDEGPVFVLTDGSYQELSDKSKELSLLYFDKYNLKLSPFKKKLTENRRREIKERYLHELIFHEHTNDEKFTNKAFGEIHYRITWPLYNVILVLIALYPFTNNYFSRRKNSKRVIISSISALTIILLNFSIKNLVTKDINYVGLMYANLIIASTLSYIFILRDRNNSKPNNKRDLASKS
jgi:lipopolysaccharide export system permease protein